VSHRLTIDDLVRSTGESDERLLEIRATGLIGSTESGVYSVGDIETVRLVQSLERRGYTLQDIQRAERIGTFIREGGSYAVRTEMEATYSLAEAADKIGMDADVARRLWEAAGLVDQGDRVSRVDLAMLRGFKATMDTGYPEDATVQLARVYADSLGRLADAMTRFTHFYSHERRKAAGATWDELMAAGEESRRQMVPLVEPSVLYFFRKAMNRAYRDDMAMHLAEEAGMLPATEVLGQLTRAVVFTDLSGFTPLTAEMGDAQAAEVLERFSLIVRDSVARHDGRILKQIGDAFMMLFPDPRGAVLSALEIDARSAGESNFPASHSGIQWGPILYHEGDYVGANVNIASRLASEAERHQVLVTADVRKEVGSLPDVEFVPVGKRRLKGLAQQLELFELRAAGSASLSRVVDPVCGMELAPVEVALRLSDGGVEHSFCSDECLRKFVVSPDVYRK
jgi:class 3 adenylate cyclase